MRRLLLPALTALIVAVDPLYLGAGDQGPFGLAVVRRDGVIVPFAFYTGSTWLNRWPTPETRVDVPIQLRDIPERWWGREVATAGWTMWPLKGDRRPLRLVAPVLYTSHCTPNVGVKTDYVATEAIPPPTAHHHPKDGLATTGSVEVERVEVLTLTDPRWAGTLQALRTRIDEAERRAVGETWASTWRRASTRETRAKTPPAFEVLCRTGGVKPGTDVYYFEAARRYARTRQESPSGCDLVAVTQGFAFMRGGKVDEVVVGTTPSDCQVREVDYMLPLGALRFGGKLFWVGHWAGTGRERYAVIEVGPNRIKYVVDVFGGGCS